MQRFRTLSILAAIAGLLIILQGGLLGCTKDMAEPPEDQGTDSDTTKTSTCDTLDHSFSQDVEPIFSNNCATSGCHASGTGAGGIVLETHSEIESETKNGNVLCAIRHESGCSNMPSGGSQLSQKKIQRIECWAEAGYPND
jgi:hypothetical protein